MGIKNGGKNEGRIDLTVDGGDGTDVRKKNLFSL
jgi:hypothetical protein